MDKAGQRVFSSYFSRLVFDYVRQRYYLPKNIINDFQL